MRFLNEFSAARLSLIFSVAVAAAACDANNDVEGGLPTFDGPSVAFGGLVCVGGELSAKASGLERAAKLAEEIINGSTNAYPGVAESDIPCRAAGNCGTWAGRDAAGNSLRGRLRVVLADTEQRVDRAVAAARQLVDGEDVPVIIGPCSTPEMQAVQSEVTGTTIPLISPMVTNNSISDIDDRTGVDKQASLPGYVYRTIVPDYIQVGVLADVGTNTDSRYKILVRNEDRTDDECTTQVDQTYCARTYGPTSQCLRSYNAAEAERDYYQVTEEACGGQPENYCDRLGVGYTCRDNVCQRFRERRYCTNTVLPQTAMILYEDSAFGRDLRDNIRRRWVTERDRKMLTEVSFDSANRADFAARIDTLFNEGAAAAAALKASSALPATYDFGDTVIFLVAGATEGALLLQEWQLELPALPERSDRVFWLGTDALRSSLLLDQVGLQAARNVFTVDPYTISPTLQASLLSRFRARWGAEPDQYVANIIDAVMLAALANDRAGRIREVERPTGALSANDGTAIKNSLQPVSVGCLSQELPAPLVQACADETSIIGVTWETYQQGVSLLRQGREIKLLGLSGNLWFSPAGDVLNPVRIWKIATDGPSPGFYPVADIDPAIAGILLSK